MKSTAHGSCAPLLRSYTVLHMALERVISFQNLSTTPIHPKASVQLNSSNLIAAFYTNACIRANKVSTSVQVMPPLLYSTILNIFSHTVRVEVRKAAKSCLLQQ